MENQYLGIWANGVTFSPTLKKTHLGLDLIYKTQKWFAGKDQIAREEGNLKDSARVLRTVPWDLGQMKQFKQNGFEDPLRV